MYVPYETYKETVFGDVIGEDEYQAYASLADTLIDSWTYGRVGQAIEDGEELPNEIVQLYSAIMSNAKALKSSSESTEAALSSFSNGVDSYGFDTTKTVSERLYASLAWMIDALPVRWISSVVPQPKGRCWHG